MFDTNCKEMIEIVKNHLIKDSVKILLVGDKKKIPKTTMIYSLSPTFYTQLALVSKVIACLGVRG